MDQDTALELVKKGATLLLLDVPQHTLIGIDTQIYSVGPIFKGIKMIPPGPHFVYYKPTNRAGDEYTHVVGFFITTATSEVVVRRWNQQEERLVKLPENEDAQFAEAVKKFEFDSHLGPYCIDKFGEWKQVSDYITKETITRIEPINGEITIACESGFLESSPNTELERTLVNQLKFSKFQSTIDEKKKSECYYTQIPNVVKRKGISREDLTALNLDKTELLEKLIGTKFGGSEDMLLGELQFAYIAFLMGQSLKGFNQWKTVITLLFSCTEAPLHTRTHLFSKFLRVIYYQLKFGFRDETRSNRAYKGISFVLDDSWFSKDSFLFHRFKDFYHLIQEAEVVDGELLSWTRKLKRLLETTFSWEFQEDVTILNSGDDEFSPTIVLPDDIDLH